MQDHDWNDLKYALALHRAGTLAGAGRLTGVDETTMSRRLKALERRLRAQLFAPNGAGRREATAIGLAVIERAERIERETALIDEALGRHRGRIVGVARVTAVPMIANRVLAPRLGAFRAASPGVTVELVPDSRNLSLVRREADLALRLARPEAGGLGIRARRIGRLVFAAYRPVSAAGDLEWIGYDDAHSHLPQARWMAAAGGAASDRPRLRVSDAETACEAVAAGLGRTLLPTLVGDADPRLRRAEGGAGLPVREVWLLSRDEPDGGSAVSAVKGWLGAIPWSGEG